MDTLLSDDELTRYARHIVLREIGGAGQRKLKAARAVVIGAGGIGSPAIQYLAASGIGELIIADDDVVELSNLQRQTIFVDGERGCGKAAAAVSRAQAINPHVRAEVFARRVEQSNVSALLEGAAVVLDGSDNYSTRLTVADAALELKIPLVSAAVGPFEGQLATYRGWQDDLPCYRCFVGSDPTDAGGTCAETGVLGPVTGVIGSLAALETLRALVPFGADPAGSVLLLDLLALRFRTLRLPKDPGCPACARS